MKILQKPALARILLLSILLSVPACDSDTTSFEPRFPLAAEHGIDALVLELAYVQAEEIEGIQSLLIQRDGVLVAEGDIESLRVKSGEERLSNIFLKLIHADEAVGAMVR